MPNDQDIFPPEILELIRGARRQEQMAQMAQAEDEMRAREEANSLPDPALPKSLNQIVGITEADSVIPLENRQVQSFRGPAIPPSERVTVTTGPDYQTWKGPGAIAPEDLPGATPWGDQRGTSKLFFDKGQSRPTARSTELVSPEEKERRDALRYLEEATGKRFSEQEWERKDVPPGVVPEQDTAIDPKELSASVRLEFLRKKYGLQ